MGRRSAAAHSRVERDTRPATDSPQSRREWWILASRDENIAPGELALMLGTKAWVPSVPREDCCPYTGLQVLMKARLVEEEELDPYAFEL